MLYTTICVPPVKVPAFPLVSIRHALGLVNRTDFVFVAGPSGYSARISKREARAMLRRGRLDGFRRVEVSAHPQSLSIMAFHKKTV